MECLNCLQKTLNPKKNLLELEKDFKELKDRELTNRNIKIRKEIEELFFKSSNVPRGYG